MANGTSVRTTQKAMIVTLSSTCCRLDLLAQKNSRFIICCTCRYYKPSILVWGDACRLRMASCAAVASPSFSR